MKKAGLASFQRLLLFLIFFARMFAMHRLIVILFVLAGFAIDALAAQALQRQIHGFSPDGRWFAFAEYGVQDGSGFAFADLYVIDLLKDAWAPGTPIRVLIREETAEAATALRRARMRAADLFERLRIAPRGRLLASLPATQIVPDRKRLDFYPSYGLRIERERRAFVVRAIPFPAPDACRSLGVSVKGLAVDFLHAGEPPREVYRDSRVPGSRHCPMDYELTDVIAYQPPGGTQRYVLLVRVFRPGFEGPDAFLIAIPVLSPPEPGRDRSP
jgi:predicted secreted protein